MKILAIHDGHTSTACLFEEGQILGMASEERFTKTKNQGGFPYNTIQWLLSEFNTKPENIDHIVFAGLLAPIRDISAYAEDRHKWFKAASRVMPDRIMSSKFLTDAYIRINKRKRKKLDYYQKELSALELDTNKVSFVEHHDAHAATAYYLDWNYVGDKKKLIFSLDGSGDGLSATVSIGHKGKLERIASIPSYHSIGILYSRMTAYLGMKPLEHEYKLMGMAPYAPEFLVEKSYDKLKKYFRLDNTGLHFENTSGVWGHAMLKKFQKDLFTHRFDGVCGGLQKLTEELVLQWIKNWMNETGIYDICLSGGVFMNVKINMLINEMTDVQSVFFVPSCGDESIALGAALHTYAQEVKALDIKPLTHLYWGPEFTDQEIEKVLRKTKGITYKKYDDINEKIVELLMEDKIVGRCYGRMEFGARSLGNRSIIGNPRNFETVGKINRAIKMRDFWMPFAPSILSTAADRYLASPRKNQKAPFMILGFQSTELAKKELISGLHQSDFTCRPQIVEKEINPDYFDLLSRFEKVSGIGSVLNTSFNIHGYPIVNGPEDALWTLENSDLDAVQLGSFLVTKQ